MKRRPRLQAGPAALSPAHGVRALVCVALLTGAAACRENQPSPTPAEPAALPSQAAPNAPPATPRAAAPEVPTQEDFELEANEQITSKTLEAELDQLERELKGQ